MIRLSSVSNFLEVDFAFLKNIKIIFLFSFLISLSPIILLQAQPGNVYLKNYAPNLNNINSKSTAIAQGGNGIMYFANSSGILSYDGKNWENLSVPSIPIVLATNPYNNKIFVGCKKNFGYLDFDFSGKEVYISISKHFSNFEDISKIIFSEEYVYFYCLKQVFCYSVASKNITQILPPAWNDRFNGFFKNNDGIFVNIEGKGLHRIRGNKLWKINNQLAGQSIIAAIPFGDSSTIIYTNKNCIYLFNKFKLTPFKLEDENYLRNNTVISGIELSNHLFVLSTLSGGCIIINKNTGKTNSIINYQTGLPDNEVFAIATDKLGGLWISHNYGVTRADNELPITCFSSYPGLKGNLTDVIKINEKLYVATSEGVFLLAHSSLTKNNKTTENQDRVCKMDSTLFPKQNKSESLILTVYQRKTKTKPRKELVSFDAISNKTSDTKKEENKIEDDAKSIYLALKLKEPLTYNSPSLSKNYNPCSFEYAFIKIAGINKKCNQLIFNNGKLLASTITDLYEIENGSAKLIISRPHINTIYVSIYNPNHIYIGTDNGITLLFLENGEIKNRDLGIKVSSMVEDKQSNLWIGGVNQLYKFELEKNGELSRQYTYPITANFSDYIKVRNIDDNLWFFSGFDIFHYNNERDFIYKDSLLKLNSNIDKIIYAKNDQPFWIFKDMTWKCYSTKCKQNEKKMIALSVINNIRNIHLDDEQNCWVINENNNLYRLTNTPIKNHVNTNLFVHEARSISGEVLPINNIVLKHNKNAIRFLINNPYYINENAILYQYFLEGVMKDWSPWSSNRTIDFPYLPYGNFKLIVRSKNVFGHIIENKGINFSVENPYWLRWWFYLLEIGGIFLLLSLSIYFNRNKNASFLSKSLLLLSVVIAFKLIQAVIEANISVSPVFDFSASVVLVYAILKVEKIILHKITKNTRNFKTRVLWKKRKVLEKINNRRDKKILTTISTDY